MLKHKTISIFNRIERERTYYLPHIKSTMFDYKQFGANTITGHKTKKKRSGIQNNFKTATMEHILWQ